MKKKVHILYLHSPSLDKEHFPTKLSSPDDNVIPQVHLHFPYHMFEVQDGMLDIRIHVCVDSMSSLRCNETITLVKL